MTATFSERLQAVSRKGNLKVSDLARWFDRPHPTVRGWVIRGLNPGGGPADVDEIYEMLAKLESFMQRSKMLPVPIGLSPADRIRHVKRMKQRALSPKGY